MFCQAPSWPSLNLTIFISARKTQGAQALGVFLSLIDERECFTAYVAFLFRSCSCLDPILLCKHIHSYPIAVQAHPSLSSIPIIPIPLLCKHIHPYPGGLQFKPAAPIHRRCSLVKLWISLLLSESQPLIRCRCCTLHLRECVVSTIVLAVKVLHSSCLHIWCILCVYIYIYLFIIYGVFKANSPGWIVSMNGSLGNARQGGVAGWPSLTTICWNG